MKCIIFKKLTKKWKKRKKMRTRFGKKKKLYNSRAPLKPKKSSRL